MLVDGSYTFDGWFWTERKGRGDRHLDAFFFGTEFRFFFDKEFCFLGCPRPQSSKWRRSGR
jgi:hypothetical protein